MPDSNERTSAWHLALPLILWVCLVFAPVSTKLAGLAWLLACMTCIAAGLWQPRLAPARSVSADVATLRSAAFWWLAACMASLALEGALLTYWHDGWDTEHARLRLLVAAISAWILVRRGAPEPVFLRGTAWSLALACAVAAGFALLRFKERSFPTHPIPWAAGVSFLACVVLPLALPESQFGKRMRIVFGVAALLGTLAVVLSLSRGIYPLIGWVGIVLLAGLRAHARQAGLRRLSRKAVAAVVLVVCFSSATVVASFAGRVVSHIGLAVTEFNAAWRTHAPDYDSSVGARVYLWKLGGEWASQSPWLGMGAAARVEGIQAAGRRLGAPTVEGLGHLHNEYLNAQVDYGAAGVVALMLLPAGLLIAIWRLRRRHPITAWQLGGVLFMHLVGGLSNVNFAHNYYGSMMALAISLAFAMAAATLTSRPCPREPPAPS